MHFVTIIVLVDASGGEAFVYGNALPPRDGLREADRWHVIQRNLGSGISVKRYTSVLNDAAFADLQNALLAGAPLSFRAQLADGEVRAITIAARPAMIERGPVRASRADFQRLSPLLYADEDHRTLWSGKPNAFFDALLGTIAGAREERATALREFLTALREFVPVPFDHGQFWRVGCFEIVDLAVAGSRDDDVRFELLNDRTPLGIRVVLSGAIAANATHLRIQAYGGMGGSSDQRVLDRVLVLTEPAVDVDLPEACVNFRIDAYGGSDGRCLCSRIFSRFTGVAMSSYVVDPDFDLQKLPPELKAYVERGISNSHPGVSRVDPWATAQATAVAYERRDFPVRTPGFYMEHKPEEQIRLVRAFLKSAGAGTMMIADPYFDAEALEKHLVGQRNVLADVVIVTSLDVDTSPISARLSDMWGVPIPAEPSSFTKLLQSAEKHRNQLPRRLRIVNVTSKAGLNGKQFHDRFVRVNDANNDALWWLGNSLNSVGRQSYPLFAAEVSGQQRLAYGEYIRQLGDGTIPRRENATVTEIFKNQWISTARPAVTPAHPEMEAFPGWMRVIVLLCEMANISIDVSDESSIASAIVVLRDAGLLADNAPHPSWSVTDARSAEVARSIAQELKKAGNVYDRLADFADWASNGGISGADIAVDESVVMQLLVATRNWITLQQNDEPTMWSFTQRTFEEAIAHFHARADGPEDDYYSPILSFVRDIAIANAPERYWQFVSREKRDRVYGSVIKYDWQAVLAASIESIAHDQTLVAEAIGLLLVLKQHDYARTRLRNARLAVHDEALGMTAILMTERRPLDETWALLEPLWTGVRLSEPVFNRLWQLLEQHRDTLKLAARLAEGHQDGHYARDRIISEWSRYLPLIGGATAEIGNRAFHRAGETETALVVADQFLLFSDPGTRFVTEVIARLDLRALTAPFAKQNDYNNWRDTANALARVLVAGGKLLLLTENQDQLAQRLARLVGNLNRSDWGDASHDLLFVNAAISLARTPTHYTDLNAAIEETLDSQAVPEFIRLVIAIYRFDDAARIETLTRGINIQQALGVFLVEQRQAILEAVASRLTEVASDSNVALAVSRELALIQAAQAATTSGAASS
jgi:hypothetical protein